MKLFFSQHSSATFIKKNEIRVQNGWFAGEIKRQDEFKN